MDPEIRLLRARVEELEARVLQLERRTGIEPEPLPEPVSLLEIQPEAGPPPPKPAAAPPPIPASYAPPPPTPAPEEPAQEEEGAEGKAGLVWMNAAGAVTFILGMAWLFKYAVDNDWIGPLGRVVIGVIAGLSAVWAADLLWHRNHRTFAKGLSATGITTVYLAFAAAYQFYHLIPQTVALALTVLAVAAAGWLALRYDTRVIAVLALLGGYLAPFMVSSGQYNDIFFGTYMFLLNAAALTIVRRKHWLSVECFGAVSTILLFGFWILDRGRHVGPVWGGLFTLLQFGVFVPSPFSLTRYAAAIPAMAAAAAFTEHYHSPMFWTWAFAILGGGLAVAYRRNDAQQLTATLAGWMIGFLTWDPSSTTPIFAWITLAFAVIMAAVLRIQSPVTAASTVLTVNGLFYFWVSYAWLSGTHEAWMGLLALLVAGCYAAAALWLRATKAAKELMLVAAAMALVFVTLAIPIQFSGYSITLAWAVECAVLAYLAARFENKWPFAASWITGFLAVSHVLFSDSDNAWGAAYSPLLNSRLIPFVVTSICLALNAWFLAQWKALPRFAPGVPFLMAHFTMIIGLLTEVFAWIESRVAPGTGTHSEKAVAGSLVLALYGIVLVSTGFLKNFRPHRVLGLLLFAIVVLKLYLIDIWTLSAVYRIIAFVLLGGLLLAGSFLYSRYRDRLHALLKDNQ